MKTPIPAIEKVIAERTNSSEENINIRLFWAYKHSLEAGNGLINFYDVIWERDIEGVVENVSCFGVRGTFQVLGEFVKYV